MEYKLLTPGPLSTSTSVKRQMLIDHCTWDKDYKNITQEIRSELLRIANLDDEYTTVLMQGSGSFGVESVITSTVPKSGELLILVNGAYGKRMISIADFAGIKNTTIEVSDSEIFDKEDVKKVLEENKNITHVAMVHSETTTGILNNIEEIGEVVKSYKKVFIVDAMSSFAGVEIDIKNIGIDFLISSANKCVQGVPGFSFIICKKDSLENSKDNARSLCLNLYDQYLTMNKDGKWRFTSPTHTVLAFRQTLRELEEEGGIKERSKRYRENNNILNREMEKIGFKLYLDKKVQGPIISTFLYPDGANIDFKDMYDFIKERGYIIYPGKLTEKESFRIGNIGEIYKSDIYGLISIFKEYLEKINYKKDFSNLEAVIFDWAGTTVDFGCIAPVEAFRDAFLEYGIEVTEEETRKPMGLLKIDHIREMLKMDRINSLWEEKYNTSWTEKDVKNIYEITEEKILENVKDHSEVKPHLLDAIELLRSNDIKIGSTTGYTDQMMEIVTKVAEKEGYKPDFYITPNSVNNMGRPYPFMIFENMKALKISSTKNVVKVGDTVSDIKEGKSAGLVTIGVLDGSSLMGLSKEKFDGLSEEEREEIREEVRKKYEEVGADYIIKDLSELGKVLNLK